MAIPVPTALATLSLQIPDLRKCTTAPQAVKAIEEWKRTTLKVAYRAKCHANHPDLGPPEEEAERNERMKAINSAHTALLALRLQMRRPTIRLVRVKVTTSSGSNTSTTYSHSTVSYR